MRFFPKILNNKLNKIIQGENHREKRNRLALSALRRIGFSPPEIRKGLIVLNGINVHELAKEEGISSPSLYNTVKGIRENPRAKEILAGTLGLEQEDLFPGRATGGEA